MLLFSDAAVMWCCCYLMPATWHAIAKVVGPWFRFHTRHTFPRLPGCTGTTDYAPGALWLALCGTEVCVLATLSLLSPDLCCYGDAKQTSCD